MSSPGWSTSLNFDGEIRDAEKASFLGLQARPVLSPVHVRHGRDVGVLGASAAAGPVELVGTDVDEAGDVAVVGVVERDDLPGAGVDARHAQGEVVGLGARVDEEDHAQLVGEGGHEALGVKDQVVVQEPVVGVEDGHLLLPFTSKILISNMRDRICCVNLMKISRLASFVTKGGSLMNCHK